MRKVLGEQYIQRKGRRKRTTVTGESEPEKRLEKKNQIDRATRRGRTNISLSLVVCLSFSAFCLVITCKHILIHSLPALSHFIPSSPPLRLSTSCRKAVAASNPRLHFPLPLHPSFAFHSLISALAISLSRIDRLRYTFPETASHFFVSLTLNAGT